MWHLVSSDLMLLRERGAEEVTSVTRGSEVVRIYQPCMHEVLLPQKCVLL